MAQRRGGAEPCSGELKRQEGEIPPRWRGTDGPMWRSPNCRRRNRAVNTAGGYLSWTRQVVPNLEFKQSIKDRAKLLPWLADAAAY